MNRCQYWRSASVTVARSAHHSVIILRCDTFDMTSAQKQSDFASPSSSVSPYGNATVFRTGTSIVRPHDHVSQRSCLLVSRAAAFPPATFPSPPPSTPNPYEGGQRVSWNMCSLFTSGYATPSAPRPSLWLGTRCRPSIKTVRLKK